MCYFSLEPGCGFYVLQETSAFYNKGKRLCLILWTSGIQNLWHLYKIVWSISRMSLWVWISYDTTVKRTARIMTLGEFSDVGHLYSHSVNSLVNIRSTLVWHSIKILIDTQSTLVWQLVDSWQRVNQLKCIYQHSVVWTLWKLGDYQPTVDQEVDWVLTAYWWRGQSSVDRDVDWVLMKGQSRVLISTCQV